MVSKEIQLLKQPMGNRCVAVAEEKIVNKAARLREIPVTRGVAMRARLAMMADVRRHRSEIMRYEVEVRCLHRAAPKLIATRLATASQSACDNRKHKSGYSFYRDMRRVICECSFLRRSSIYTCSRLQTKVVIYCSPLHRYIQI